MVIGSLITGAQTLAELEEVVTRQIDYHNNVLHQLSIDYQAPAQYFSRYLQREGVAFDLPKLTFEVVRNSGLRFNDNGGGCLCLSAVTNADPLG